MTVSTQPAPITIVASLCDDPHFKGSIHDDMSARTFGYQDALVPGPVVYGYLSQIPIEVWGMAWLERGTMSSRSRRPVYQGDEITRSEEHTSELQSRPYLVCR